MRYQSGLWFGVRQRPERLSSRYKARHPRSAALHFEPLEARSLLAGDTFTLNFDVPADVASQGVWASVNGKLTQDYKTLASGDFVYYDDGDYAEATTEADLSFQLDVVGGVASLEIPNTPITSGQVVIGVGGAPDFAYNGTGISSPGTQDQHYFGLFEFTLDGTAYGDANNSLDIDLSEVDQVGVPFYVTSSPTAPPYPAEDGFGITMQRDTLFNNYQTYAAGQASGIFGETYSQGNLGGKQYRIVAPKDLNLGNDPVQFPTTAVAFSSGGTLTVGQPYFWFVTATSATGESTPSIGVGDMTATAGQQTANVSWNPYVGATGYKVYRSTTNDAASAVLVGQVSGYATNTFADTGSQINATHPPTNGYMFSALNGYYNDAINAFFDYYASHPFSLYYAGDSLMFTGGVTTHSEGGNTYTVLELSPLHSTDTYRIYKPFFSDNMDPAAFPGLPPAPSWMPNASQSPADMIFSCDGAFASGDPSAPVPGYLADLGNAVASAFNRGLADQTSIQPSSWANNPALFSVDPAAGNLPANQDYYYVITAETGYDDTTNGHNDHYTFGESVISLEQKLAASGSTQGATLAWQPIDPPNATGATNATHYGVTQYHIYRSTTPGTGYKRIQTIVNGDSPPATSWTDTGETAGTQTPPSFFAPGSTSNWYAAYWHRNSTNDATNGASINGLAYGYPYDDQGGFSTNIQWGSSPDGSGVPDTVTIHLTGWGSAPSPPTPNPNPHPNPSPQPVEEPAKIVMLDQPSTVRKGRELTIQFQVLNASGQAYQGGGSVNVRVEGTGKGSYTVEIDDTTGIGTLTFKSKKLGVNMLELSMNDGDVVAYSDVYQVVSDRVPKRTLQVFDKISDALDTKAFRKVLKRLARHHR